MIKKKLKKLFLIIILMGSSSIVYAQSAADNAAERAEFERERRREEIEELRQLDEKPKTAEDVLDMLKQRVEEKKAEAKHKAFWNFSSSLSETYIMDKNPASSSNDPESDEALESNFGVNWRPRINNQLSGNVGYSVVNLYYFDQDTLSTLDNSINSSLTYKMMDGRLSINPGFTYQYLRYPNDDEQSYTQLKPSLGFTHYFSKDWNWGGKYDWSHKWYDRKDARDDGQSDLGYMREDYRNTGELWVKRFVGPVSVRLKGKSYRNISNDQYQNYNHYDAHKGEVTISGSFLERRQLYVSLSSDIEAKHYHDRLVVSDNTVRSDRTKAQRLNLNYTLPIGIKLSYNFSYTTANSNEGSGVYDSSSHKVGMTYNF